uniref:Uncharacterized protein n=1 Tax=Helicotheca tamesis TaxID=374047 RepID=A0A7S2IHH6_9STRA|mmetsp:Transcript_9493/g.13233  ORF Transcript_9493/g.13233 Transcript_9493/m.13233 type:complete len:221 (+) Transcript_9493:103-765(+)|eukprot:CAMPEP_0185724044 /NCGR_PEP_ID=MMETSP1171-20130828/652_1 /TAXON_ID=374046 /ORGANISM="Helicotheca tamensis, Strain CCMP826" /LENGTH=220 /DNA_ID=CAMNT_0028391819 /DNA_START=39 /DNA_END=701 /DNA_ORIENTATION=-
MARLTNVLLVSAAAIASTSAFAPSKSFVAQRTAQMDPLKESFGFDFAEDSNGNQVPQLRGEAAYKEFVGDGAFLNEQYPVIKRVRELDLIKKTAEYGILSKLEKNGVDLETIESLLPTIEDLGLLSTAGNNQQLLVNLVAFFAVEGAPFLLPLIAGALDIGPAAFYGGAAAFAGLEGFLLVNNVEVPFVGLSAGAVAGLLLVPLTLATGGAGVLLASAKK